MRKWKRFCAISQAIGRSESSEPRQVEIPVCYGGEFGPDLADVCAMHGMTPAQAIELHASAEYLVYFLGSCPGRVSRWMPEALVTPRLAVPRRSAGGSVGSLVIRLVCIRSPRQAGGDAGRTPLRCFERTGNGVSLLSIGDRVRFTPISTERFGRWRENGVIQVQEPGLFTTVQDLGEKDSVPWRFSFRGGGCDLSSAGKSSGSKS